MSDYHSAFLELYNIFRAMLLFFNLDKKAIVY